MREFLMHSMKTDKIDTVNLEELKLAIHGVSIVHSRVKYRKEVGKMMYGNRPVIVKD